MDICFSIIMPTYNQASFIRRAILSLYEQTYPNWELIIINDGSTDETEIFVSDLLTDERISYIKNEFNQGLGYALNQGLAMAKYDLIAYLPSDDYYYENHLELIYEKFQEDSHTTLVYTGIKYDSPDTMCYTDDIQSRGARKGYCLQLVQTAHRRTGKRWLERKEWVTDDLFAMFWHKLLDLGVFCSTNQITCFWTSHPAQRHRIINENHGGGLNKYRSYYQVHTPIKMKVGKYKFIDEEKFYTNYRAEQPLCESPLKILLVGELAYSPERIFALEQAGHKLYGLWMPDPVFCFSMVGPLPFGHVEDIPLDNWIEKVKKIQPDVIYGMLNFSSVAFAYDVMKACPHIPFVWHFKEGPSISLRQGNWDKLIYLYAHAAGKIFLNDVVKKWFEQFLPPTSGVSLVMDGDLPKRDCFKNDFSPKLSAKDGAIHTVVAGRMIGVSGNDLAILAQNDVHVHLYTENYFADRARENIHRFQIAPKHFHVHAHVAADNWTKELSQYDAGWLHCLQSQNNGSLLKAAWDDMNIPVRINTYMAAGLPVILYNNANHIVATQDIVQRFDIGVLFSDCVELSRKLEDAHRMEALRSNVLKNREWFCFDYHVPELVSLFRKAIKIKRKE